MLRILYGTDRQQNADRVLKELCACREEPRQILIVPEQFSFDAEWRLSERGGDTISRYAEVLSFTRLYDRVCSLTGGAAVRVMDRSGRLIAMAGALEQVRSRLKQYGTQTAKPEFLLRLLTLYEEFQSCGVAEEQLAAALRQLSGALAEKLEELSLIFESYEAVCAQSAIDPATRLSRLADRLTESDFASGRRIWIDGFTDFTAQELDVISALLQGGAALTVSLCCDDLRSGREVYEAARETARQLRALYPGCERISVPEGERLPAFAHLAAHLFGSRTPVFSGPAPLAFAEADSAYGEALCAVAEIQALVRQGVRWREIAVACTDLPAFQPILNRLFTHYHIPGFFSGNKALLQTPVVRMLLSALRAACGRMELGDVLDYLKSDCAPLTRDACDALENYAVVWNLRGSAWRKPLQNNPAGLRDNRKPSQYADELALLNEARDTAIVPLLRLRDSLREAKNTGGQILALAAFLEEIRLAESLSAQTERLQQAGDFRRAQQNAQIYDALLDTMEQIYGVLGASVRTPEDFYQFLRAALSQSSVGVIPATLDCVCVASLQDLRNSRAPYLVILGATDGLLPAQAQQTGLLTRAERKHLQNAGLSVAPDEQTQLLRELAVADAVLRSPTKGLYLTCRTDEPCYLLTRLQKLFPEARPMLREPQPADALEAAAQQLQHGAVLQDPALLAAAGKLRQQASHDPGALDQGSIAGLYGKTLHLSATQADKLADCRLAYFLKYGVKAQARQSAQIDAAAFGLFVHAVLQDLGERVNDEGGFHAVTAERVSALTQAAIDRYVQAHAQELGELPLRERHLFRRSFAEVLRVAQNLWEELRQSAFVPVAFELPFQDRDAIRVHGRLGDALLRGYVDRVDRFDAPDGTRYIRVVDYKTGSKDFSYTDLLIGRGLQMLIYLYALRLRADALLGGPVERAGVLYMPAQAALLSSSTRLSPEDVAKERIKGFRRKGLVLDNETVRRAMEPSDKPIFLPCHTGRFLADAGQFEELERFVVGQLETLSDTVFSGSVAPNPYRRGAYSPCERCEYKTVCHTRGGAVAFRELAETDEKRFWLEVERRNAAHG